MKTLIVFPSLEFGGIERTTINLVGNFRKISPSIVLHRCMERHFEALNARLYRFEDLGAANPSDELGSIWSYSKALKRAASAERPQAVLAIMQYSPLYAVVAKDLLRMKSKAVVSFRGVISEYFKIAPPKASTKILLRLTLKRATSIVVPSEGVKRDLVENFGAPEEKTTVIYNGIDLDFVRRAARAPIDAEKDRPWIVCSSRLSPQKDFSTLLRAFRLIRDKSEAKLLLLGDGPLKEDIRRMSESLGIERDVELLGFQENPFKYMARGDVFVLSSHFEGFGNVLVEAMALGVPVVSTDCPSGPGEIIEEGRSGLLVPAGDAEAMARGILDVLGDEKAAMRLSEGGIKRSEEFSADRMAEEYEEHLLSL